METFDFAYPVLLVGIILASTFLLLIIVFGLVMWWLRRQKTTIIRRWEQEGRIFLREPAGINFSGIESKGPGQVRGNGFMALTDQDLRLTRAVPAAEWRIPHRQIKQVSLETSFLGKYRGMPALVITFEQAGQQDRIGLYVRNRAAWIEAIARAAGLPQ